MGRPKKVVEEETQEIVESQEVEQVIEVPAPAKPQDPVIVTIEALILNAQKFLNWASIDRDYIKRSKNESIFLAQKNQAVSDAIRSQESFLEGLKAQGGTILSDARREAEAIKKAADEVLALAHREKMEAKKLKEDAERELSLARMKIKEMVG